MSGRRPSPRGGTYMPGGLISKGGLICQIIRYWPQRDIFDHAWHKIIIYCLTRAAVSLLAESLGCLSYTSKSGMEEVKAAIVTSWIADKGQPVIVATSALGIGFDYLHVR